MPASTGLAAEYAFPVQRNVQDSPHSSALPRVNGPPVPHVSMFVRAANAGASAVREAAVVAVPPLAYATPRGSGKIKLPARQCAAAEDATETGPELAR